MTVSRAGVNGVRVHWRHEHKQAAGAHAHGNVKTEEKAVKEHETKQIRAEEINAQEVDVPGSLLASAVCTNVNV